ERLSSRLLSDPAVPVTVAASPAAPAQASPAAAPASPAAASGPSAGAALSAPLRARFGAALPGLDRVRIDTSAAAHRLARGLGAEAVTLGPRIAFAPGRYAPGTPEGDRLLAHELVHTVQQARSGTALQRATEEKTAAQGPVGVHGGLVEDAEARTNVFVAAGETLQAIAARLLPYWSAAEVQLPDEGRVALPPEIRTAPGLAKALLVYHQDYLLPPELPSWRAGLRLPLPMRVAPDGTRYVDVSLAARWLGAFDPAWTAALTKPAGKAQPMEARPEATPLSLGTALLTNAGEAAPAVLSKLAAGDAAAAIWAVGFLETFVTTQIEVLNAQPAGRTVLARLRAVLEAETDTLAALDQGKVKRAFALLNAPFQPSDAATLRDVALGFKAQAGSLCMEACYVRLGKLQGGATEKDVRREVARQDALTSANTDNVIAIMQVLQSKGLAGPPITVTQATFDAGFDRDPEGEIAKLIEQAGNRPGYYFFGMSVVTGYHTVILAVDNTNPAARGILWLDQNFKREEAGNFAGALSVVIKEYAKNAEEVALASKGRSYGRYETQLWPLYPPSQLILPAK
ncbi:MAG: DUF4157 domain-containing protein, partial [Paracoccaceae bacterium]|nr:DUF4157 domain-containing protein [Paracoccaceae bacterium]